MIDIDLILVAVELALLVAFAVMASRVDVSLESSNPLANPFPTTREPARRQGVQEADLPRFVFRDRAPSISPA
jgi:hypothetical protein